MSGPKTSRYTLTAEQRRILAEQRMREQKLKEVKVKIKNLRSSICALNCDVEDIESRANELKQRNLSDNNICNYLSEFKSEMNSTLNIFSKISADSTLESLQKTFGEIRSAEDKLKLQKKILNNADHENTKALKSDIKVGIDKGFKLNFGNIKSKNQAEFERRKEEIFNTLNSMQLEESITGDLRNKVEASLQKLSEINNAEFLRNFNSMTVVPLINDCNKYISERNEFGDEYDELNIKYTCLCETVNKIPEKIEFSRDGIEKIKKLIADIESEIAADDEQAYITDCIDDVMEEMGYDLLGIRSVIKKNGKRFHNELYSFSDGTAVNVTFSADGKITMELGGIGDSDRLPNADETDKLCEYMRNFCSKYNEFEQKLEGKGIVSKHISILPPQSEYAQIINISEYDIKSNISADIFESRNINTKNVKRMNQNE